jgi:peroxiredoxin
MHRFAVTALALVLGLALVSNAPGQGKFNKKVAIGDAAPTFTDLPGTDGKKHSLGDFKGKEVVVVVITCNHCPVAVAYEDRIIALAKKYAPSADSKVAVVAINVNNLAADKLDKMKERAKNKGFNFPYLYDESQKIGRALGATVTPEFFVLNKDRKIAYMGALDDSQRAAGVKHKYVEDAIDALLKGEKISTTETRARGCSVKYERSRSN